MAATWGTPSSSVRVSRKSHVNKTRGQREKTWRDDYGADPVREGFNASLHAICAARPGGHGHRSANPTQRREAPGGPPGDGLDHALPRLPAAVDQWPVTP